MQTLEDNERRSEERKRKLKLKPKMVSTIEELFVKS
jgi:hypothetical protein